MERVAFSVVKNALIPASDEARAVMGRLSIGEQIAVEVYRERSNKFASKVHFVFERIAKSYDMTVRNVRGWIAALTGRADLVTINGKAVLVPWGTGPRDMSGAQLQSFWEDARDVIQAEILPTLRADDRNAIAGMLDDMSN